MITQHLVQVWRGSAISLTLSYPEGRGVRQACEGLRREDTLHWELLPIIFGAQLSSRLPTPLLRPLTLPFQLCLPGSGSPSTGLLRPRFIPASAICKLRHPKQVPTPFRASALASIKWASQLSSCRFVWRVERDDREAQLEWGRVCLVRCPQVPPGSCPWSAPLIVPGSCSHRFLFLRAEGPVGAFLGHKKSPFIFWACTASRLQPCPRPAFTPLSPDSPSLPALASS